MASKGMKHVVWVPFSIDRDTYTPPPGWVEWRIELFEQFTLPSMLGQTFDDFEIWLSCGHRHRKITNAHAWHPRVRLIHEKAFPLEEIDADYLAISRLDSDDLYRDDALEHINEEARKRQASGVLAFVLNKNLLWNRLHGQLGRHYRLGSPPPFVTRVYPQHCYRDPDLFHRTFFVAHGRDTVRTVNPEPLDIENLCCIVKHGSNTSLVKKGLSPEPLTAKDIQHLRDAGTMLNVSRQEMEWTLARYSVKPEDVFLTPGRQYLGGEMVSA